MSKMKLLVRVLFLLNIAMQKGVTEMSAKDRIHPYEKNPFYWQHNGKPALLIGGSVEDNLFQIPDLEAHLDLLAAVGGNYVRCTMSSRDEGNVWPFEKDPETGLYDLNKPGEAHWARFERFLELTAEREIFAQFEMWDRFDFTRDSRQKRAKRISSRQPRKATGQRS